MNVREYLFKGFSGCSNHGCVITGPKKGMGTNGMCSCMRDLSPARLSILGSRISTIGDYQLGLLQPSKED